MNSTFLLKARLTHDNEALAAAIKRLDDARMEFHHAMRNLDNEIVKAGISFEMIQQEETASFDGTNLAEEIRKAVYQTAK